MATALTKPLIRETGLQRDGKPVYVTLVPNSAGGSIVFKEKGGRKGVEVPLSKVMASALGIKRTPVAHPDAEADDDNTDAADLIDMRTLEARVMIEGEGLTPETKGCFWGIVREIREERREDLGLPPVVRGPERSR